MLRRAKKHQKKLAKLVLAALLCTGGAHGLVSPSVAEAAGSVTVTGYSNGTFTTSEGSMIVVPESEYGYYIAYPDEASGSVNFLKIAPGETDTWTGGNTLTVYGHYAKGASSDTAVESSDYIVNMTGANALVGHLYGGYAEIGKGSATAGKNTVTVDGNATVAYVYGGYGKTGDRNREGTVTTNTTVSNNEVSISGNAAVESAYYTAVYGGYAYGSAYADANNNESAVTANSTANVTASNNEVSISGNAAVSAAYEANIYGGYNNNDITAYAYYAANTATAKEIVNTNENEVTISGISDSDTVTVGGAVYGGSNRNTVHAFAHYIGSTATAEGTANANENVVTISGISDSDTVTVTVGGAVYGGSNSGPIYANTDYGQLIARETANADGNKVTISGAAVEGAVYGGSNSASYSYGYSYYSTATVEVTGSASKNEIIISSDANVDGDVYGGYNNANVFYVYASYNGSELNLGITAKADKNTIIISSDANVDGDVYGGHNITNVKNSYAGNEGSVLTAGLTASADNNEIEISGAVEGTVYGGYNKTNTNRVIASRTGSEATNGSTASTNNNTVTVKDSATVRSAVYGGYNNVDADAVHSDSGYYYDFEYGYGNLTNTINAAASNNEVSISGAAVSRNVIGGEAYAYARYGPTNIAGGTASANEIIISDNASIGGNVYGGRVYAYSTSGHQKNAPVTATAKATANANGNGVSISDTTITAYNAVFYGSAAEVSAYASFGTTSIAKGTASADNNTVTISDTAADSASVVYYAAIYGGQAYASTAVGRGTKNSAEATASADKNTIIIRDVVVDPSYYMEIYGGYAYVSANANASEAPATADELTANAAASANNNTVTISGDTIIGSAAEYFVRITGGFAVGTADTYVSNNLTDDAESTASANNNTVTISGGTIGGTDNAKNNFIIGGYSNVEASGNKVTIEGDTTKVYAGAIIGGGHTTYYVSNAANGKAIGNIVTISAKGAEIGSVYGGRTVQGDASENKVTLTAGSVTGNVGVSSSYSYYGIAAVGTAAVAGGYTEKGDATLNVVEIRGISVSIPENGGSGGLAPSLLSSSASRLVPITLAVVGGYAGTGNATDNTVKLQGATIIGSVYGGATNDSDAISISDSSGGSTGDLVTGNTLILGGINTVKGEVTNFETIKLADTVEWGSGTTVLKADQFTDNADGTRASLDVKDAEANLAAATSGQMKLLASDTENDFKTLSLVYSGGTEPLSETNPYKVMKSDAETTETTPVNGVTLTSASTHLVSLDKANDYKNVLYKIENLASKITFGDDMAWGTGRDLNGAYTFVNTATVDASNLSFTGTTATVLKKNDEMTLVSNATGISSILASNITQPGEGKGKVAIEYTDSNSITFNATASGTVGVENTDVKFTVSSVTADKITLTSQAWGTTANMPDSSWTASASTQIDDTGFAYTGTASTALKTNDTAAILNAKGLTTASPVTDGTVAGKTVDVNYKDKAGVTYTATASGHVAAAKDTVNYVVDSVAPTGVNLQNWNGKNTSATVTTAGWTGTGVAVATGSFAAPTDMKLGESRTIATAPTGFFGTVTGTNAHPQDGGTLNEKTGGVKLAGSMVGGVKAEDDGTTARLTYYAMKKTADTMTLGTFTFVNGNANARTYGSEYDLTNATIITDGLTFTDASKKTMETGNKMTLVDASGAYKDGGAALKALDAGAKTSFDVEFSDDPVAVTDQSNITVTGKHTDTLVMVDSQKLEYTVGNKVVGTAKLDGTINWVDNGTHYTNKKYQFDGSSKVDIADVKFTSTTDPKNQSMTLIKNAAGLEAANVSGTPDFTVALNNTTLTATAAGSVSVDSSNLKYTVTSVTLDKVTVNSTGDDAVPDGWAATANVTVDTDKMDVPADVAYGKPQNILTADSAIFTDDNILGKNKYGAVTFKDTDNKSTPAVTIAGIQDKGVKASADGKSLVYEAGKKNVSSMTLGAVKWAAGTEVMDASSEEYDFAAVTSIGTDDFAVTFDAPEKVDAGKGESMTLLKANATLSDMAERTKKNSYRYNPVSGVTVKAAITGTLTTSGGVVTYTPTVNQASKLTFGNVQWNQSKPLLTRPSNIVFAGADVDTSKINFVNMTYLDANQKMTLVSDFGDSVGTITGSKYMVGTAFEGEGKASLSGSNLIFTTKTEAGLSEQTHKTLMAMDTGLVMLNTGNEFVGKTIAGLADNANKGSDGISTFASVGGGTSRYSTGSHVNTHTWNAVVGVGKTNETKKGTIEYGIFGEYGKGSYKLHSDAGNGDGDAHYAGGGLLAKWISKHNVYAEASFRAGRLSDSANDIMQDGLGNKYGYNVHANYYGAHVGAGKIINYKDGKSLDVYGKFFYMKRNGVEYDAVQHYNLDSVSSSILRIGARYGTTDKKWNWYGGLAYEYEFDGKATGTVNGKDIRAASIKGSSVRGEFGMRMNATKDNPWQADISIYGYGGKHRGFGGNVSVAYTF